MKHWTWWAGIILIFIGLLQIIGFSTNQEMIWNMGAATAASPFPVILSGETGIEVFNTIMSADIKTKNATYIIENVSDLIRKIKGPHHRKIVYIHAVNFYPAIEEFQRTQVLTYGFCNEGSLAQAANIKDQIQQVEITISSPTNKWGESIICQN